MKLQIRFLQVFSCEYCEIFKNSFFKENFPWLPLMALLNTLMSISLLQKSCSFKINEIKMAMVKTKCTAGFSGLLNRNDVAIWEKVNRPSW